MAARFWVLGTGTWDAATTTNWSATSGGAGGASVPGSADDVTFDGASGGGTVTVNFGGTITILSLTMSAFTGTLDFATNNNNITLSAANAFSNTGAGTRTLNMGNGTWTLSNNSALWSQSGATNLTFNSNSSTIAFTGTGGTGSRRFSMGTSRTYATVTVASGTSLFLPTGTTSTITTLTISPGNTVVWTASGSVTITTLSTITGSSSLQTLFSIDAPTNGRATISSANNWTTNTWCGFSGMTFSGGGTFTADSSYDFKGNSGITINPPSAGGGIVGVIGG